MSHTPQPRTAEHPEQNRIIVISGVASVVILAIMLVWLRNYFFTVRNEVVERNYLSAGNPQADALRAHEDSVLTSYGWVNPGQGLVRIPVDRAMELVAREAPRGGEPALVPGPGPGVATP